MKSTAAVSLDGKLPAQTDVYRKIAWRIMPLVVICYIGAYLDRVNVGFAKLKMLQDLGMSDAVYGLGAGIFFIGYFIFEVPSNLILHKVGARRWIARIMVTWAVISAATLFVQTPTQFYLARFLLGLAEAGFSPGVMLYLTYWFPSKKRASALAIYYIAIPLAGVIGGPLSGWILDAFSASPIMRAWQWLFLIEAVPTFVIGVFVYFFMVDRPDEAPWLSERERAEVTEALRREDAGKVVHANSLAFLSDWRIWKLSAIYFMTIVGLYGITFWLPSIVLCEPRQERHANRSSRTRAAHSIFCTPVLLLLRIYTGRSY